MFIQSHDCHQPHLPRQAQHQGEKSTGGLGIGVQYYPYEFIPLPVTKNKQLVYKC